MAHAHISARAIPTASGLTAGARDRADRGARFRSTGLRASASPSTSVRDTEASEIRESVSQEMCGAGHHD